MILGKITALYWLINISKIVYDAQLLEKANVTSFHDFNQ